MCFSSGKYYTTHTQWGLRVFQQWQILHNTHTVGVACVSAVANTTQHTHSGGCVCFSSGKYYTTHTQWGLRVFQQWQILQNTHTVGVACVSAVANTTQHTHSGGCVCFSSGKYYTTHTQWGLRVFQQWQILHNTHTVGVACVSAVANTTQYTHSGGCVCFSSGKYYTTHTQWGLRVFQQWQILHNTHTVGVACVSAVANTTQYTHSGGCVCFSSGKYYTTHTQWGLRVFQQWQYYTTHTQWGLRVFQQWQILHNTHTVGVACVSAVANTTQHTHSGGCVCFSSGKYYTTHTQWGLRVFQQWQILHNTHTVGVACVSAVANTTQHTHSGGCVCFSSGKYYTTHTQWGLRVFQQNTTQHTHSGGCVCFSSGKYYKTHTQWGLRVFQQWQILQNTHTVGVACVSAVANTTQHTHSGGCVCFSSSKYYTTHTQWGLRVFQQWQILQNTHTVGVACVSAVANTTQYTHSGGCVCFSSGKYYTTHTHWGLRVFQQWRVQRTEELEFGKCPEDLLENPRAESLNFWLSRFVVEARRADGNKYPSSTTCIYHLLAALLRYSPSKCRGTPNFLDKSDPRFRELRGACESISRQLRQAGVGAEVKHAALITPDEEDMLWTSGVLGVSSPKALVRAVFYYVGKTLCLREGQEQRGLKPTQFKRAQDSDRYTYIENGSKNYPGSFSGKRDDNKIVTIYANPESHEYFAKFPKSPDVMEFFYLKPLQKTPVDPHRPWFEASPIGKNTLGKFVQCLCKEAGISGKKTNHSLRATGTTALFSAAVPEKLIKSITGHKSTEALQLCERPTVQQ